MGCKFWTMKAAADEPTTGELRIYGPIGPDDGMSWLFDEITPKQFAADLDGLGAVKNLHVYINSPGGDVFAGQAIHSMLQRHPAAVTVHVDGLAASIASIVAMAGDTVLMPPNAMMMIHNPWSGIAGDARDMRKMADTLDTIRESMIAAYQGKTGMDRTQLLGLLNSETWMTAAEAIDLGFADRIEETAPIAASLVRPGVVAINGLEIDLTRFRNAPAPETFLRDAGGRSRPTKRDLERALREAGLSQSAAKAVLARGYTAVETRDAGLEADPEREPEATTAAAEEAEEERAAIEAAYLDFQRSRAKGLGVAV
jgi:ATP-dependent Clp protease protease subunit